MDYKNLGHKNSAKSIEGTSEGVASERSAQQIAEKHGLTPHMSPTQHYSHGNFPYTKDENPAHKQYSKLHRQRTGSLNSGDIESAKKISSKIEKLPLVKEIYHKMGGEKGWQTKYFKKYT